MANVTGGSVIWNFDVDKSRFDAGLAEATAGAKAAGAAINNNLSKTVKGLVNEFDNVANSLGNVLQKIGLASVAGAALGGIFVKSAADLQVTSKSMQVLVGNTEQANELFGQLAVYANQTPFEFPDIARAGKTLLGFGINIKDVFPDIRMLGDLAGVTGADFNSLAVVFGQVNATGRLMGQDALQLINNNIPITTILAKKLGTSVQDIKARMEEGAISADLFNEALKETTSQGGFAFKGAEQLAQTFSGRLSTLKDQVLEFGRNLLGVKVDPQLGLIVEPGGVFDKLSQLLPKIGEELKKMQPAIQKAFDFLIKHGDTLVAIIGSLAAAFVAMKIGSLIGNIVMLGARFAFLTGMMSSATAAQWGFNTAAAANPIGLIVIAIAAVVAALVFLQLKFKIFTKAWDAIKTGFKAVVGFFQDHAETFKKIFIGIAAIILAPILPLIALGVLIVKNFDAIKNAVVTAFTTIYNIVTTVITAVWNVVSPILNFFLNLFIIVFGSILIVVLTVLNAVKDVIVSVFNFIWGVISTVIGFIWDRIVTAFNFYKDIITTVLTAIFDFISMIWNKIYDVISGIVGKIIDFFRPAFTWLFERGKDIVNGLVNGIRAVANAVWEAIKFVADKIGQFFSGAAHWLFDTGKAIINGLVDGIKAAVKWVADAAESVGNAVKDKFKSFFGIHSPSKLMAQLGEYTMQGFTKGIEDGNRGVVSAMNKQFDQTYQPMIAPIVADMNIGSKPTPIVNNIGEIHIGSEVDGENWLKKLTRDEEVTSAGLTPYAV